VYKGELIRF